MNTTTMRRALAEIREVTTAIGGQILRERLSEPRPTQGELRSAVQELARLGAVDYLPFDGDPGNPDAYVVSVGNSIDAVDQKLKQPTSVGQEILQLLCRNEDSTGVNYMLYPRIEQAFPDIDPTVLKRASIALDDRGVARSPQAGGVVVRVQLLPSGYAAAEASFIEAPVAQQTTNYHGDVTTISGISNSNISNNSSGVHQSIVIEGDKDGTIENIIKAIQEAQGRLSELGLEPGPEAKVAKCLEGALEKISEEEPEDAEAWLKKAVKYAREALGDAAGIANLLVPVAVALGKLSVGLG